MIHLTANLAMTCAALVFSADTEKTWEEVVAEGDRKAQQVRIRMLVNLLESENAIDLNERTNKSGKFPPENYDQQAQVVVYLATQQLLREGSAAFDTLIENFDNKRYSFTHCPNGHFHLPVGAVCRSIVRRTIFCYEGEVALIAGDQDFVYPVKDWKEWWDKNRDRPLWKIQVEVIDEAIQVFKNVDRKTARPFYAGQREPLSEEKFEAGLEKNLRVLREIRAVILEREEAYVPKSIESHFAYYRMVGVPWRQER